MIKFSVAPVSKGSKVAYKNYQGLKVSSMERVAELTRTFSFSSYIYGSGVTDSGQMCDGHRAGRSVTGAGNVLLFDFDNKGITFEALCDRLDSALAWIGPSKSWSPTVAKFHAVIVLDRELPLNAEQFTLWYSAVAQWFGLEGQYDPAMDTWVQQLAPHGFLPSQEYPEHITQGAAVNMDEVLAAYVPLLGQVTKEGGHFAGVVPPDTEFVVSSNGKRLTVEQMVRKVEVEGKVRTHCIKGLEHDGRRDTAFVRSLDGVVLYHCAGGRCGETLVVEDPKPFPEDEDEGYEERRSSGTSFIEAASLAENIVASSPFHVAAFNPKVRETVKEQAVAYAATSILESMGVAYVEGRVRVFDGKLWVIAFEDDAELVRFVQAVFRGCGFEALAHSNARVTAVVQLLKRTLRKRVLEKRANVINLENGVLEIDRSGVKLLPHCADYLFTYVLPFSYDAECEAPVWESIVDRIMLQSEDLKTALQDALGYLFLRDLNFEKMIGFVGEGENGKSTVHKVLKMLLGPSGVSNQPLHVLTKGTGEGAYARAMLAGKLVNLTNELAPGAVESEAFKNLISGEDITARMPYGQPFELAVVPKQLVALNSTDKLVREHTHGFMRRLHLIPFAYRIKAEDKDPGLWDKLVKELSGIMNWVLVGAARVAANNKLTEAPEMEQLFKNVLLDANPVQQFLEERTEAWKEGAGMVDNETLFLRVIPVNELFSNYLIFCEDNRYKELGRNKFSAEVERLQVVKLNKTATIKGVVAKISGFYLKKLKESEWREGGVRHQKSPFTVVK